MKLTCDSLIGKAVDCLLKENIAGADEAEIYRFGLEITLLKAVHLISYFGIAACMKKIPEFIIIFGVFYAFRRNTGGFHAKTRMGCYWFSGLMVIVSLAVTKGEMPLAHICGLSLCELMILWLISPVKNDNRPMDEEEISCFRKRLFLTMALYAAVFLLTAKLGYYRLVSLYSIGLTLTTVLVILGKIQEGGNPGEKQEKNV